MTEPKLIHQADLSDVTCDVAGCTERAKIVLARGAKAGSYTNFDPQAARHPRCGRHLTAPFQEEQS